MNRFLLFVLLVLLGSKPGVAIASAKSCPDGALRVEFVPERDRPELGMHAARLTTKIETPDDMGYLYSLSGGRLYENELHIDLQIYPKVDFVSKTKSPPFVLVDHVVGVPKAATRIFIDVSKNYSGSPEYFRGKFDGYKPLCLLPEMYK